MPDTALRKRSWNRLFTIFAHVRGMTEAHRKLLRAILKMSAFLLALNEIRGLVLAAPVFYAMYQAGGSLMAIWLGVSSLLGIAASVIIPLFAARKLDRYLQRT